MHHHQSIKKGLSVNPCCVWDLVGFSVLSRMKLQVGCRRHCRWRCVSLSLLWLWLWLSGVTR